MLKSYIKFWRGYVNWNGNASRKEYWIATLINILIINSVIILCTLYSKISGDTYGPAFFLIFLLTLFLITLIIPSVSLIIRRLNDSGIHWSWIFIVVLPILGIVILFILNQMPSKNEK